MTKQFKVVENFDILMLDTRNKNNDEKKNIRGHKLMHKRTGKNPEKLKFTLYLALVFMNRTCIVIDRPNISKLL